MKINDVYDVRLGNQWALPGLRVTEFVITERASRDFTTDRAPRAIVFGNHSAACATPARTIPVEFRKET